MNERQHHLFKFFFYCNCHKFWFYCGLRKDPHLVVIRYLVREEQICVHVNSVVFDESYINLGNHSTRKTKRYYLLV